MTNKALKSAIVKSGNFYLFYSNYYGRGKPVIISEKYLINHSEIIKILNTECVDNDENIIFMPFHVKRNTLETFARVIRNIEYSNWVPHKMIKKAGRKTNKASDNTMYVHTLYYDLPYITKVCEKQYGMTPYSPFAKSIKNVKYKNLDKFVELHELCNFLICDVVMDILLKKLYVSLFYGQRSHVPIIIGPHTYKNDNLYRYGYKNSQVIVNSFEEIVDEIGVPINIKKKLLKIKEVDEKLKKLLHYCYYDFFTVRYRW